MKSKVKSRGGILGNEAKITSKLYKFEKEMLGIDLTSSRKIVILLLIYQFLLLIVYSDHASYGPYVGLNRIQVGALPDT